MPLLNDAASETKGFSRRRFVSGSAAILAASAGSSCVIKAQHSPPPPPAQAIAAQSLHQFGGIEQSIQNLISRKLAKVKADPEYNPFASGEIAVSMRYLFEQLHRGGITAQVEQHIEKNGMVVSSEIHYAPHLNALAQQNIHLPPSVKQSFIATMTSDASRKASVFEAAIKQHGLWAWHDGMYSTSKAQVAQAQRNVISRTATRVSGNLSAAHSPLLLPVSSFSVHRRLISAQASAFSSMALEPLFTCGTACDPAGGGTGSGANGPGGAQTGPGGDSGGGSGGEGTDRSPGEAGDVDTSEDANGNVVYEKTLLLTTGSVCDIFTSILQLGSGLTTAAIAAWKETDPEAAAAFAAALGFSSVSYLILAIIGIGGFATYYNHFCSPYSA